MLLKNDSVFKIFFFYLKDYGKIFFSFIILLLTFLIVFYLYKTPFYIIKYSLLLVSTFSILLIAISFISYFKKYKTLIFLYDEVNETIDRLSEANTKMEERYQDIIKKLYNEKLDLISKADILKSDMMDYYSMWVHQIKTPISALNILLKMNNSNEAMKQELFKIEQYVEMVLNFLKIDDMSDLVFKTYDISNLVKQAIKKYSILFIYKKIKLQFSEENLNVITDEKWLTFVIEQLISNALKYTNEGSISISIDCDNRELTIKDTGIGIYDEDIPRVFEKGFTGYNGRMDKKSTGIGLYLCKTILTKLSHTISITSKVGSFTKVTIRFPVKDIFI